MKLQTAVLDDERLYWNDSAGNHCWELNPGPAWVGRFCEHALKNNLHTIWVTPGSEVSRQVYDEPNSLQLYSAGYDARIKYNSDGIPVFGSVKRERGTWEEKRLVYFGFPEHDPRWMTDNEEWALADIENPIELLHIITSTEKAHTPFRVVHGCMESEPFHMGYGPGYCGSSLFKSVIKLHGHVAWIRESDLSMLPVFVEPGGFVWKRALTPDERGKRYIHFFDRNAQFPAAATGAECGEGTPEHVTQFTDKGPGVWCVNVMTGNINPMLPTLPMGERQWAYTSTVQAMKALGYEVQVLEGFTWRVHHRTLQDWSKLCWEARKQLRETYGKNSPQERLAKMIANQGLQWFDLSERRIQGRDKEPLQRQDWLNTVHSLARYRMVLKLIENAKLGYYPVMIVADNIGYVSDEPNPELAIPDLMRRSTELGGFKHDGTYLMSEVLPLFDQYAPNDIRKHVKKLQKIGVR